MLAAELKKFNEGFDAKQTVAILSQFTFSVCVAPLTPPLISANELDCGWVYHVFRLIWCKRCSCSTRSFSVRPHLHFTWRAAALPPASSDLYIYFVCLLLRAGLRCSDVSAILKVFKFSNDKLTVLPLLKQTILGTSSALSVRWGALSSDNRFVLCTPAQTDR